MAGTSDPVKAWVLCVLPGALRLTGKHPLLLLAEGWPVEWVNETAAFDVIEQDAKAKAWGME